jgi:hypothetical protein
MRGADNLDDGSKKLRMLHDSNVFYVMIKDEARKAPFSGSRKGRRQSQSREPIYYSETALKTRGIGMIGLVS